MNHKGFGRIVADADLNCWWALYEKGYNIVTLTDCTAALSPEEQRLAVEKNHPMFSRLLSHTEFLERLSGQEMS